MTADEIRNLVPDVRKYGADHAAAMFSELMLREIAAQLAEFNAMVREAMDAEKQP